MFYVYVLFSEQHNRYYIGFTTDIDKRLKEHNCGKTKSTKGFVPWIVIYNEQYCCKEEARAREKYLKSAAGRRWRKDNSDFGSEGWGFESSRGHFYLFV